MKASAPILLFLIVFFTTQGVVSASPRFTRFDVELNQDGFSFELKAVLGNGLARQTSLFHTLILEAAEKVRSITQLNFKDPIWIYFDSEPDFHNGFATVVPSDWIRIHTEAPSIDSSIGFASDYLRDTLIHELAHMIVLQQRRGVFKFLSWVFGNASRPLGAWPRWLHEGTAVWVESSVGGRVGSGYINYELRKFADFYERYSRYPIDDHQMDGNFRNSSVDRGEIPYHMGYLLSERMFSKKNSKFAEFVRSSSYSLGLNFQKKLSNLGVDLDSEFQKVLSSAAKHRVLSSAPENRRIVSGAKVIIGPFSSDSKISWIEEDDDGKRQLAYESKAEIVRLPLSIGNHRVLSAFARGEDWIALAQFNPKDSNQPSSKKVLLLDSNAFLKCEFHLPTRIREIVATKTQVAWVESKTSGKMLLKKAPLKEGCQLGPAIEITSSLKDFERISSPTFDENGVLYFSRSLGRNSYKEKIQTERAEFFRAQVPLSHPLGLRNGFCGVKKCWMFFEHSKAYWGPVLVKQENNTLRAYRTKLLSTGGDKAVVGPGNNFYIKQQLWNTDRLIQLHPNDFDEFAFSVERSQLKATQSRLNPEEEEKLSYQSYGAMDSFWPRYWLPELYFYDKGFSVGGSSLFSDLTQRWFASIAAGYDTYPERPYGNFSLWRESLNIGPFSRLSLNAYYSPSVIASSVQDRWGLGVSTDWRARLATWNLLFRPGFQYLEASGSGRLSAYRYFVPVFSFSAATPRAKNPQSAAFRLSSVEPSVQLSGRLRYLSDVESSERLVLQSSLPFNSGAQLMFEHGVTRLSNYPASYFEIGGQAPFATREASFMTRGFPTRFIVAKQAMRSAFEFGFKLVDRIGAFKWNRFRLDDLEQVLVAETASFDSFNEASRFRLGRQYFSTLGVKWDLFGQAFHYANFKSSFGVYRGFGEFGQWSVSLTLSSYLDIL
ncbi:hypothetical protein GW915_02390 [bacterium]|nr:hypothetical protein [bacterium]